MAGEAGTGEQLLMRLLQTQQEQMGQIQRLLEQNQRPRGTVVDTKAIGRPEKLGGTLEDASRAWRQWNYRLELWLTSQFPETRSILTWARTQDEEITVAKLSGQLVEGVTPEKVQEFNRQLEVVLGTLTMDTPGDITMNSSPGSGLDMCRRLHGRLDPTDMVTSFRWLRQLMSTRPVTEVGDLIAAVERWEDQHRRYAARRDCTALTERQRMVSLLGLVPSELQSHLELNLPRLNTYDLLRREIVTFAENRRAFTVDDSGAIPMEVDYAKGKGQAKGKGKEKETRKCHKCGKAGHLVKDCWSTTDIRKNKDAGGSSGSGGNPKTTPGGRGRGNPPKGRAQGRGRGGKGNRNETLEGEEEEPENEEPEQEEEYEAEVGFIGMLEGEGEDPGEGDGEPKKTEGKKEKKKKERKKEGAHEGTDDESWGGWQPDSGAGSSRDPPEGGRARASAKAKAAGGTPSMTGVGLRLLEGNLLAELQGRQAELNRALANTKDTEERSDLEAQLEVVTRQLKELVAKRRAARASPAGSWRTSSRFLADVRSGRKASLAKRKELSRQRAARHRQASREGRARQRVALDGEWHRRYNRPLKGDDGKRDAYPLMPESTEREATEREARPLSRKARENLRQEGAGDDVPEEHIRSWREKPKTPGERCERQCRTRFGTCQGQGRSKAQGATWAEGQGSEGHRSACRAVGGASAEAIQAQALCQGSRGYPDSAVAQQWQAAQGTGERWKERWQENRWWDLVSRPTKEPGGRASGPRFGKEPRRNSGTEASNGPEQDPRGSVGWSTEGPVKEDAP